MLKKKTSECNINVLNIDADDTTTLVTYQGSASQAVQAIMKHVVSDTSGDKYRNENI